MVHPPNVRRTPVPAFPQDKRKDDAIKYEAAFRTSLVKGEFGVGDGRDSPTLGQFEARILPHLEAHTSPRTYGFYKSNLKILRSFVPMDSARLHAIDSSLVEQFVQH